MEGYKMNIFKIRNEKGLSICELARRSGISKSSILGIESGKQDPRLSTLKKIANTLGVNTKDLFDEL